jgi:3(or 17)beta-hydroxysteroid dehydrogenase
MKETVMGRLQGKVALVTGAARGIGAGIAQAMAGEGASVIFTDLRVEDASTAASGIRNASALMLDVTSPESWETAGEVIKREFGRLDVLVNNAGIDMSKSLAETAYEDWRRIMTVNVDSVFLGCRTMQALLIEGGRQRVGNSSVINLSSVAGIVGYPDQLAYNVSKAAVRHLTKSLAIEWAHHGFGIRSNSIHPGAIQTQMVEEHIATQVSRGAVADEVRRAIAEMAPVGRLGTIEEVAAAAVYLASDEASFVNAAELVVDGGFIAR